jgi:hypothetical protein
MGESLVPSNTGCGCVIEGRVLACQPRTATHRNVRASPGARIGARLGIPAWLALPTWSLDCLRLLANPWNSRRALWIFRDETIILSAVSLITRKVGHVAQLRSSAANNDLVA